MSADEKKDKRGRRIVFRLSDELYAWVEKTKESTETHGQFVRRVLQAAKAEEEVEYVERTGPP